MTRLVSDAQLVILAEVAGQMTGRAGDYTLAEGASQVGLNRRSLRTAIAAGLLLQTDTGDRDTCGGRYRLHLTDAGRDQLSLALARHRLSTDPSRLANQPRVEAHLAACNETWRQPA